MRNVLAGIAGIAVAVLTVMLFEWISHTVYPLPPGLDENDSQAMSAHLANVPLTALLLVLAGYITATFGGTLVACLISRTKPANYAMIIGLLMLVATVSTQIMIPHPLWFSISAVIGIIVAAWLASVLAASLVTREDRIQ